MKGAYGAAIGTILGACVLLGRIAIGDWFTVAIALLSLLVLYRLKVNNALLIGSAAGLGLVVFPLLRPAWVTFH
jgi:chromate transporter